MSINLQSKRKIKICLIVEGAYPYVVGGVSIWLHQLISNLLEFEFILLTIVPKKGQKHRFKLPRNVVDLIEIRLSDKLKGGKRQHKTQSQWNIIKHFHNQMRNGQFENFEMFYRQFDQENPKALNFENFFKDFRGWELITNQYNLNHPISPFIEYYWAWRAVHIPMFQMIQTQLPDADIYHAISTGYAGLLGAMAKVKKNKPFLLTEHGIYAKEREMEINQSERFLGYQKRMWKKNYHTLAKVAYTFSDLIIALFNRNQEIQIQMGAPSGKCSVIPNGIHVEKYMNIPKKRHMGFNVGFIGRMVPIKDVKNFIMASRIVKDTISFAHIYLIGPKSEQEAYYKDLLILVENLNLKDSVTFTGKVDVKDYFPILDVLCLSSIKEAQPLSIIESMVAGVPVVGTDVGNVADILQNDGIIVPPKSPEKLAEGVIKFGTNPEYKRACVERAKSRAIRDYDIKKLFERYGDIYNHYGTKENIRWRA